ncbi:MAG: alpha-ketoglutarate-dependent dioxygenase AlkB family protein [Ferruginibacter sp.]
MHLFRTTINKTTNLLPKDGIVNYYGKIFTAAEADYYTDKLFTNVEWKNDESFIYGKLIVTKRKVGWYGDETFDYTYSKTTKKALPWTKELLDIKKISEQQTGENYNSCLLNLYHNGDEGMGWHSDAEKELKKDGAIASLSFGAERTFLFRHKADKETVSVLLENGSLLLMQGKTQTHWLHRMPPTKKVQTLRINLTFRTIA